LTLLLLFFLSRFNPNDALTAALCVLLAVMTSQIFKPLANALFFYYSLDDDGDGAINDLDDAFELENDADVQRNVGGCPRGESFLGINEDITVESGEGDVVVAGDDGPPRTTTCDPRGGCDAERSAENQSHSANGDPFAPSSRFVLHHDDFHEYQKRQEGAAVGSPRAETPEAMPKPFQSSSESTLGSSAISIDVDLDDALQVVAHPMDGPRLGIAQQEEDVISISDPRVVHTLHSVGALAVCALITADVYLIFWLGNGSVRSCRSLFVPYWWVSFGVDVIGAETLARILAVAYRYYVLDEDIFPSSRNSEPPLTSLQTKQKAVFDLRWNYGNRLHPYNGETRER
jgi:hypothetical protein